MLTLRLSLNTPRAKWSAMKETWTKAAEEICGWTKGVRKHKETWWWNDEVAEAVRRKQESYTRWKKEGTASDRQQYEEAKREARKAVWVAKEAKCQELAGELNSESGRKSFFRIAKQMAKASADVTESSCIKDDAGRIVSGQQERNVWQRYMEQLMNEENDWDGETSAQPVQGPRCQLTNTEFTNALKSCKRGKAAGPTGIGTEMIEAAGETGVEWMVDLCNIILEEGHIPSDWTKSVLIPIYKQKGDPLECGNYRGIKLLEQAMKVYERVLDARIRQQVDIDAMQCGFMPGKGTTDAIFVVRQMQEKHLAKKKDLYFAFIDLEKAFDRVPRKVVQWALRESGVEEWLVKAVMALFEDAHTVVRTRSGDTDCFSVRVGLHQGSSLSPLLFAIVMDVIACKCKKGLPWEVLYADDLVVMAVSEEELSRKIIAWKTSLSEKGLKVNTKKTQAMVSTASARPSKESGDYPCSICRKGVGANALKCITCKCWVHKRCSGVKGSLQAASSTFNCRRCQGQLPSPRTVGDGEHLEVDGERYKVVNKFCYLGDMLDCAGGTEVAAATRIMCGWKKFRELSPFLSSRAPSLRLKGQVYDACVRSSMLYGSETWSMTKETLHKITLADTRMIRNMSGESLRRRYTVAELRGLLGLKDVASVLRSRRLRWYGHLERKDDQDWIKKVWKGWDVPGPRPVGRPRQTWEATVAVDLKETGLSPADARDRQGWRYSVRKSATQKAGAST